MNKIILIWAMLFVTTLSGQQTWASIEPRSLATDPRIKVVSYQKNNVVPIHAMMFVNTQVILGEDEAIIDIQSGDPDAWTTHVNPNLRNVLNIKPTILGSQTDLNVTTLDDSQERRYYRFELISSKSGVHNARQATYAVEFVYPRHKQKQLMMMLNTKHQRRQVLQHIKNHPSAYNWQYSFHGSLLTVPLHVFDDGKFTYMELHPGQSVPAIFAVQNKSGRESVVNYRRLGSYLVIQQTSPQFTLRDDKHHVASIFNNRSISSLREKS